MDDKKTEEPADSFEDIFFYTGLLMSSSFIFFMRILSILTGCNLPLSGNNGMKYSMVEPWRIIFFMIMLLFNISIVFAAKKKNPDKLIQYGKTEIAGWIVILGFECLFHVIAYVLTA